MNAYPIEENQIGDFVDLAWTLHDRDPLWVAPLRQPLERDLAGRGCFSAYGRQRLFLCRDGDRIVGRIAAFINPRLTDSAGTPIGQVGYFECIDSEPAARLLLEAAIAWLSESDVREVWGPMAGAAHRPHRLMVKGFERTPFLFEPRNPSYYPRLFESNGFHIKHRWTTYDLTSEELIRIMRREWHLDRLARRARNRYQHEFLNIRNGLDSRQRLLRLIKEAWSGHIGYAPFDAEEYVEVYGGLTAVVPFQYAGMITDNGRDVGMGFMYPDYVGAVRALNGDARGWGEWINDPLPNRVVLHTTAMIPEARKTGALFIFYEEAIRQIMRDSYSQIVIGLVTQDFRTYDKVFSATREYALYARPT